jgi:quercetin dioxygenase-like cupin family protein
MQLVTPPDAAPATPPILSRAGEGRRLWVVGDLVTFKATSEETGGLYTLWENTTWPGGGPPPHVHHREIETFFLLEGSLRVFLDGKTIDLRPGDFAQLPRGVVHHFKNVSDRIARFLVHAVPGGFEGFFAEFGRPVEDPAKPPPVTDEDIRRLLAAASRHFLEMRL